MRLLIDQNLPYRAVELLRARGWDAAHVSDVDPSLSDAAILEWATREGRVCVTRDSDFHAILAGSKLTKPSVVRLRIEDLSATETVDLLESVCDLLVEALESGAAVTVTR